jgi:hypothetical protein
LALAKSSAFISIRTVSFSCMVDTSCIRQDKLISVVGFLLA